MNRKELLNTPKRKWDEELKNVFAVFVIPSRRKHDSGWACMDFVAVFSDNSCIRFGGGCDDVSFMGEHFQMDCVHPNGILRIHNSRGFSVSPDVSSIMFIEN